MAGRFTISTDGKHETFTIIDTSPETSPNSSTNVSPEKPKTSGKSSNRSHSKTSKKRGAHAMNQGDHYDLVDGVLASANGAVSDTIRRNQLDPEGEGKKATFLVFDKNNEMAAVKIQIGPGKVSL